VKCWGQNAFGCLGYGDLSDRGGDAGTIGANLPTVALGTGRTAVAIAGGQGLTCALLDNAGVKCWGNNAQGELGIGDKNSRGDNPGEMGDALPAVDLGTGRTAKQIAVGGDTVCAILDNDQLKCWGSNGWCQLGNDTYNDVGGAPGQMGDALLPVDLGAGRTAKLVAVSFEHACAVLDDHRLKCWGNNNYGQLGYEDTTMRGCGTLADGGTGKTMGDALAAVDLGTSALPVALGLGWASTCVLFDDHSIRCWGSGADGNLGVGNQANRGMYAGDMGANLQPAQLGTGRGALVMTSGDYHVCAILDNGGVKCWGRNQEGQIGQGNTYQWGTVPSTIGDNLPYVDLGP
jgi:alpha-tubulin suppressor-like RCC1 family protein